MRKTVAVLMAAAMVAAAFVGPADAGKKKKPKKVERTETFEYVCPCPGFYQFGSATGTNFGGGPMAVGGEEMYVKITADDASGTNVLVSINQDVDGDGFNDGVADVCAGAEPGDAVEINPGLEMRLFITTGPECGGSLPAGGSLEVTLSNLP